MGSKVRVASDGGQAMLDSMRPETQGHRRGASTFEFALLVISIAAVLALVIFAVGSYVAR